MLYKDITTYLKNICSSHIIINDTYIGFEQLHLLKDVEFPIVYIRPDDIVRSEKILTYNFYLYYADRMGKDFANMNEIVYQSQAVLNDIITKLLFDEKLEIIFDIVLTPFVDSYDQTLCGHEVLIQVKDRSTYINNCENNFI